jgi:DNA-directed RNA polymerase subunit M/transcription elongation factor TFIIS
VVDEREDAMMPRWLVTWTRTESAELCVEAENVGEVMKATRKLSLDDLGFDPDTDLIIDEYQLPDNARNEVEAVAIDGELLDPRAAVVKKREKFVQGILRAVRLTCPKCQHEDWTGEFHRPWMLASSGKTPAILCPRCQHEWSDDEIRAAGTAERDTKTLELFR